MAPALDLTVTPWDTLGSGVLTGKYNRDRSIKARATLRGEVQERDLGIAAEVVKVAEELGRTPAQVALRWVLGGPGVIVPLVGARTREQLDDNLGCLAFELEETQRARLDEVSRISLGFPHDFLREMTPRNVANHRGTA
jgi:aryl-alcohol dehydrogenase-like predicted oxidoreductase